MKNITTNNTEGTGSCKCGGCGCGGTPIEDKAKELGVPVIPRLPDKVDYSPRTPNPIVAICGECGLEIHQVMGYVCSNPRCPTGFGGPSC